MDSSGDEYPEPSIPIKKTTSIKKSDKRKDPATVSIGGLRRYYNTVSKLSPKERESVMFDIAATIISKEKNPKQVALFISQLADNLEMIIKRNNNLS